MTPTHSSVLITQRVVIDPATGEARDALAHDWALWLTRFGLQPVPVSNALADPTLMLSEHAPAGLILTGGGSLSDGFGPSSTLHLCDDVASLSPLQRRDRTELILLREALKRGVPVLAICRGMQFVNAWLGGSLRRGISAPHGPHASAGSSHAVRFDVRVAPPELVDLAPEASVRSFHDDGMFESDLAPGLIPWAWSDDRVVEGLSHRSCDLLAVQWHPEREPDHVWSAALLAPMLKEVRA